MNWTQFLGRPKKNNLRPSILLLEVEWFSYFLAYSESRSHSSWPATHHINNAYCSDDNSVQYVISMATYVHNNSPWPDNISAHVNCPFP